jgi:alpha-tubulin suppressor-like RCC1 family protein
LGNGTVISAIIPLPIQTGALWKAVAAGERHTLALREDGALWAWGDNGYGQLGNGSNRFGANPPQPVGTNKNWTAVATGQHHSLALRDDGSLWTWGANFEGQLGNGAGGAGQMANVPTRILTNAAWKAIATGDRHCIALREDGMLWGWGWNNFGQLGNGYFGTFFSPYPVASNWIWKAVTAGANHTVALREDGTLWSWGDNTAAQLGHGAFPRTAVPLQIQTNGTWKAVAAGGFHTVALREDGAVWAWGRNFEGQLGSGDFAGASFPQPVPTGMTWISIAAGRLHTVALRDDGTLWVWGSNHYGQIAQPVPWLPTQVDGGAVWASPP